MNHRIFKPEATQKTATKMTVRAPIKTPATAIKAVVRRTFQDEPENDPEEEFRRRQSLPLDQADRRQYFQDQVSLRMLRGWTQ